MLPVGGVAVVGPFESADVIDLGGPLVILAEDVTIFDPLADAEVGEVVEVEGGVSYNFV